MSLRAGQQRSLNRIEQSLRDDDRHLGTLFEFFARLTRDEAMPLTEMVAARRWSHPQRALAAAIGLAAVVSVIMLGVLFPGPPACPASAGGAPATMQPLPAGRTAACPARTGRGVIARP